MLDQDAINYITDLVEDYMRDRRSFTSLDIANQAKDEGHWARNHEVAHWLRANAIRIAYEGGYPYNQSLIRVDSKAVGMTLAYCYHHYLESSDDYLDRDQNPKSFVLTSQTNTQQYFPTRERARDFARNNPNYQFRDNGWSAPSDERWSCIPR